MSRRDLREALTIMGRETVADAIAHRIEAKAYWLSHPKDFQIAVKGLRSLMRNVPAAITFVQSLPPDMRRALTAAWVGDVTVDMMAEVGLDEDTPPLEA